MRSWAPVILLLLICCSAGCGGSDSSPAPPASSAPPPAPSTGGGSPTPVNDPIVVNVGGGQQASGIDINVSSPANAAGVNAENLGVTELNGSGSAQNTGALVNRGSTKRVILFGRALSGALQVTVMGPKDVVVSNVRSITSQSGKSGVAFDIVVSPTAALGARTVLLRDSNNDMSTFTGGLEIVP